MILLLFLYDPLYTSSHDLESDYPWSSFEIDLLQKTKVLRLK
jgi:hypothetical protein